MSNALNPMLYVCVMSTFNLPEFASCLKHRPSHVLMMVSNHRGTQEGAERFEEQLRQALPEVEIIRPDKEQQEITRSFNGADFTEVKNWVEQYLVPIMKESSLPKRCNITGGTKAITLVITDPDLAWDAMDYKGEHQKGLQVLGFNNENKIELKEKIIELPTANPVAVAKLSSAKVQEKKDNPIFKDPQSSVVAKDIWNALDNISCPKRIALLELFGDETAGLERIWAYGRENKEFDQKKLILSAQEFVGQREFSREQLGWLTCWQQLEKTSLNFNSKQIELPGNKGSNALKRWLMGDWLEQLVAQWLAEVMPQEHFVTNLKVNPLEGAKGSEGERETDIVVHHNETTHIIEVKTDLPPQGKVRGLLDQITSMGDRLGRTNKVLFIGPQLKQKLDEGGQREEIEKRCKADSVMLADNKESLFKIMRLTKSL